MKKWLKIFLFFYLLTFGAIDTKSQNDVKVYSELLTS